MENILIVDDDAANRQFMSTLCKDFAQEHDLPVTVYEAADGFEAVSACNDHAIDIIFMDIMMPNLDGIAATREIRKRDKETMIIAVSAAEDEVHQNTILQVGAEDYIKKPVVSSLFFKRFEHYRQIHQQRKKLSQCEIYNPKVYNLYTHNVYNTLMTFTIDSEECLALFWEEMLVFNAIHNSNEHFSELIRCLYFIGTAMVNKQFRSHIYVEQDATCHYFTIERINLLNRASIEEKITRNFPECEYRIEGSNLSFKVHKEAQDRFPKEEKSVVEVNSSDTAFTPKALQVFDFMSEEHLIELEEMDKHLNSSLLYVKNSEISDEEVQLIVESLQAIADIITVYDEVFTVGEAVENLANVIAADPAYFQEQSKGMSELFYAFVNDLEIWRTSLFVTGAPGLHFLDDSILSNSRMIQSILQPEAVDEGDLDAIFDF